MNQDVTIYNNPTSMEIAAPIADEIARRGKLAKYQRGLSIQTLRRHKTDIRLFKEYLALAHISTGDMFLELEEWRNVSFGLVEGFLEWQIQQGYAMGSINVRLATVKKYASIARDANILSAEQIEGIRRVTGYQDRKAINVDTTREDTRIGAKKGTPTPITSEQIKALREVLSRDKSFFGKRDYFLLCLLGYQGLRCGEVASLRISDIQLAAGRFTVYRQKVNINQIHKMHAQTQIAAKEYLDVAKLTYKLFEGIDRDEYTNKEGKQYKAHKASDGLSNRAIYERIRLLGKRVGIVKPPLSPHDLRHYWTGDLFEHETQIDVVMQSGGWKNYKMPLHYRGERAIANEGVKQSE